MYTLGCVANPTQSQHCMLTLLRQSALDVSLAGGIMLLAMGVCSLLVTLCDRMGGTFADVVRTNVNKLTSLEGLRGILALAVVAHHSSCWYSYTQTEIWTNGAHNLFARFGPFGVGQFFYISGFLFWRKLMKTGSVDFVPFYMSRFLRIAPVYYTCIFLALLVGFSVTGFGLHQPQHQLVESIIAWACFTIGIAPNVNGVDVSRITAGVTWTLACEWVFYLSLPLLGWFSRKSIRILHLIVAMLAVFAISKFLSSGYLQNMFLIGTALVFRQFAKFMLIGFGGGIVLANFDGYIRRHIRLSPTRLNLLLAGSYAFYFFVPSFRGSEILQQLSLFAAFAIILQGADLFGFLKSRPIRFLGSISYDIYLLHGIVLYSFMLLRGGIHPISARSYGIQTSLAIIVVLTLSSVVHFLVERPSMRVSEAVAHRSSSKGGAGFPIVVIKT